MQEWKEGIEIMEHIYLDAKKRNDKKKIQDATDKINMLRNRIKTINDVFTIKPFA
jgi:hypothetical protein